ncbi:MAG: hypothetical protein NTW49_03395 [Bacteroidia bacterium]|nr:hypothetical protein [Bacteroidia bacterium]
MVRFFFFSVLLLSLPNVSAQELSFVSESITMKIENHNFYVSGIYNFEAEKNTTKALIYPFPVNPLYADPDSVSFYNVTLNKEIIPNRMGASAASFNISFKNVDQLSVLCSYRQKLLGNRAEYILKSTIGWRKPLKQANYQLIVPKTYKITKFSNPPQDSVSYFSEVVYFWSKPDYMPMENMIFEFK